MKLTLPLFLFGAASLLLLTPIASADSSHSCQGNANCSTTTNNVDNDFTTNKGGEGGVGIGIGVGKGGDGGSATIERGAVDNTNLNLQGQKQKQQQQQSASSRSTVRDSGNSVNAIAIQGDHYPRETASAYSPALVAAQETCVQSQSAGAQGPAFGISLGFSHDNDGCNRRRNAAMLFSLKHEVAAVELMCGDDDVRDAMKSAGTPCAADRPAPVATVEPAPEKKAAVYVPMLPVPDSK